MCERICMYCIYVPVKSKNVWIDTGNETLHDGKPELACGRT